MEDVIPGLLELSTAIVKGEAVAFVGAGLSAASGAPLWDHIAAHLKNSLRPATEETSNLLIAQFFRNQYGDHALIAEIRRALNTAPLRPNTVHHLLCSLPVQIYLTTNFDSLIESALTTLGRPVHTIATDRELALWNEAAEVQVLKIHGDLNNASSIVITEEDYLRFLHNNKGIQRKLLELFSYRTLFFIGYSLRDADITQLYSRICYELDCLKRPAYIFSIDDDFHLVHEWARRGIRVLHVPVRADHSKTEAISDALALVKSQVQLMHSPNRCDVLVVEDDIDNLSLLSQMLDQAFPDFTIVTASDGLEASLAIGKLRPRLVLIDLMMPRMDGWKLIEVIKRDADLKSTKLIIVSAFIGSTPAHELGVDACVAKPVDLERLVSIVGQYLE